MRDMLTRALPVALASETDRLIALALHIASDPIPFPDITAEEARRMRRLLESRYPTLAQHLDVEAARRMAEFEASERDLPF